MKLAKSYVAIVRDGSAAGWDKLEGMLTLVYSYLLSGDQQKYLIDQAKYLVPLMSRMSFSAMLKTLPEKVRLAFNPDKILENAGMDPSQHLYSIGYKDPKDPEKDKGPVRRAWLESIIAGNDMMSLEGGTKVTTGMKASSPAMGAYSVLDSDVYGTEKELVQIEIRRIPGSVPPEDWEPLAVSLFEMFQDVQDVQALREEQRRQEEQVYAMFPYHRPVFEGL